MEMIFDDIKLLSTVPAHCGYRVLAGRYVVFAEINRGGMGAVFRAVHCGLEQDVALKVATGAVSRSPLDNSFAHEAQRHAKLLHPNLIRCLDVGHFGGRHYLTLDYIDGENTLERVRRKVSLPCQEAAAIIMAAAYGAGHLHENGFVHRDLTPDNLLVSKKGEVKVIDLGIAKSTGDAAVTALLRRRGKSRYVPLEYIEGPITNSPAIDVYSLGATLFHLIDGRPGLGGNSEDPEEVAYRVLKELRSKGHPSLALIGAPAGLAAIADRATAVEPRRRYPHARALADDLANWLEEQGDAPDLADPEAGRQALENEERTRPSKEVLRRIASEIESPTQPRTAEEAETVIVHVVPEEVRRAQIENARPPVPKRRERGERRVQRGLSAPSRSASAAMLGLLIAAVAFLVGLVVPPDPGEPPDSRPTPRPITAPRLAAEPENPLLRRSSASFRLPLADEAPETTKASLVVNGALVPTDINADGVLIPELSAGRYPVQLKLRHVADGTLETTYPFELRVDDGKPPSDLNVVISAGTGRVGETARLEASASDGGHLDWCAQFGGAELRGRETREGDIHRWTSNDFKLDRTGSIQLDLMVKDDAGNQAGPWGGQIVVDDDAAPQDFHIDGGPHRIGAAETFELSGTLVEAVPTAVLLADASGERLASSFETTGPGPRHRRWTALVPRSAIKDGQVRLAAVDALGRASEPATCRVVVDLDPPQVTRPALQVAGDLLRATADVGDAKRWSVRLRRGEGADALGPEMKREGNVGGPIVAEFASLNDGRYVAELQAWDDVGNRTSALSEPFLLDREAPKLSVVMVGGGATTGGRRTVTGRRARFEIRADDLRPIRVCYLLDGQPIDGLPDELREPTKDPVTVEFDLFARGQGPTPRRSVFRVDAVEDGGSDAPRTTYMEIELDVAPRWKPAWADMVLECDSRPSWTDEGLARRVRHGDSCVPLTLIDGGRLVHSNAAERHARIGDRDRASQNAVEMPPQYTAETELRRAEAQRLGLLGDAAPLHLPDLPAVGLAPQTIFERLRRHENGLRMSTDVEWEFACTGGRTTIFRGGNTLKRARYMFSPLVDEFADPTTPGTNAEVALREPTRAPDDDFADFHGNAAELCIDASRSNEQGPSFVLCGGSWRTPATRCRVGAREVAEASNRQETGVRLVADVPKFHPDLIIDAP